MIDTAFFYAAGLGTRMRPLTDTRPKPLIEVAGKTLLEHAIDPAREAGITRLATNVHYLADQIERHPCVADFIILDERSKVLETGGGLKKAAQTLGNSPLFTMNTDAVWSGANPFSSLHRKWNSAEMGAFLLLVRTENARGYSGAGDFQIDAKGRLQRGSGFVYTGCQIIDPSGLANFDEDVFSTNLYWDRLCKENKLYGLIYEGLWCDVGRPSSIGIAEEMLEEAKYV